MWVCSVVGRAVSFRAMGGVGVVDKGGGCTFTKTKWCVMVQLAVRSGGADVAVKPGVFGDSGPSGSCLVCVRVVEPSWGWGSFVCLSAF